MDIFRVTVSDIRRRKLFAYEITLRSEPTTVACRFLTERAMTERVWLCMSRLNIRNNCKNELYVQKKSVEHPKGKERLRELKAFLTSENRPLLSSVNDTRNANIQTPSPTVLSQPLKIILCSI